MALPYKLLKTITIDGETMGVDTTVGDVIVGSTGSVTIGSSTAEYLLSEINLEPNTLYWIGASARFETATTTGTSKRALMLYANGFLISRALYIDGSNEAADHQYTWVYKSGGGTNNKLQIKVNCNKVQDVSGYIAAFKLLSYTVG